MYFSTPSLHLATQPVKLSFLYRSRKNEDMGTMREPPDHSVATTRTSYHQEDFHELHTHLLGPVGSNAEVEGAAPPSTSSTRSTMDKDINRKKNNESKNTKEKHHQQQQLFSNFLLRQGPPRRHLLLSPSALLAVVMLSLLSSIPTHGLPVAILPDQGQTRNHVHARTCTTSRTSSIGIQEQNGGKACGGVHKLPGNSVIDGDEELWQSIADVSTIVERDEEGAGSFIPSNKNKKNKNKDYKGGMEQSGDYDVEETKEEELEKTTFGDKSGMTRGSNLATSNEKPLLKNQIVSPGKAGDRADIVHSNVSSSKDTATGPSSNTRTTSTPIPSSTGNDFGHGADGKAQYRYNDGDAATAGGLLNPNGKHSSHAKNANDSSALALFEASSAFLSPLEPTSTAIDSVPSNSNSICLYHEQTSTTHEAEDECHFVKEQLTSHNHHNHYDHHFPPLCAAEDVSSLPTHEANNGASVPVPVPGEVLSTSALSNSTVKVAPALLEQIAAAVVCLLVGGAVFFHAILNNKKHCYSGHPHPETAPCSIAVGNYADVPAPALPVDKTHHCIVDSLSAAVPLDDMAEDLAPTSCPADRTKAGLSIDTDASCCSKGSKNPADGSSSADGSINEKESNLVPYTKKAKRDIKVQAQQVLTSSSWYFYSLSERFFSAFKFLFCSDGLQQVKKDYFGSRCPPSGKKRCSPHWSSINKHSGLHRPPFSAGSSPWSSIMFAMVLVAVCCDTSVVSSSLSNNSKKQYNVHNMKFTQHATMKKKTSNVLQVLQVADDSTVMKEQEESQDIVPYYMHHGNNERRLQSDIVWRDGYKSGLSVKTAHKFYGESGWNHISSSARIAFVGFYCQHIDWRSYDKLKYGFQTNCGEKRVRYHENIIDNSAPFYNAGTVARKSLQQICPTGQLLSRLECLERNYCPETRLYCSPLNTDGGFRLVSSETLSSSWSVDGNYVYCDNGYYANGLTCDDHDWCYEMRLECVKVQYTMCRPIHIPSPNSDNAILAKVEYDRPIDQSAYHLGTKATITCDGDINNSAEAICTHTGWDNEDLFSNCRSSAVSLLPESYEGGCPPTTHISKNNCAAVALSLGGKLRNNEVVLASDKDYVPFGCSLFDSTDETYNNDAHYSDNEAGVNGGRYKSICYKIPYIKLHGHRTKCLHASKEECAVAGLSVGGDLHDNNFIEVNDSSKPRGCFLDTSNIIHFNTHENGYESNDDNISVCKEVKNEDYIVLSPQSHLSCPTSMAVTEEDCQAAGQALGGILLNNQIETGTWDNRPSGCSFGTHIIFNYGEYNAGNFDWNPVCQKMEGVLDGDVLYEDRFKCPENRDVNKEQCIEAGIVTVGSKPNQGVFEGHWGDKPSGCFTETIGSKYTFYNTHNSPSIIERGKFKLLCQWTCQQLDDEGNNLQVQDQVTLGCKCIDGYVVKDIGLPQLREKGHECESTLNSLDVTHDTITYKSKYVTEMVDEVELFQRSVPNDIKIYPLTGKQQEKEVNVEDRETVYSYPFSGLEPGHRYILNFFYMDTEQVKHRVILHEVTSCRKIEDKVDSDRSCSEHSDKTGKPTNFNIFQDQGHVMFSFKDCSVCEEAYSFTRSSLEEGNNKPTSFTHDYYFISRNPSGDTIEPFTDASDNIATSNVVVGMIYEYCVRAVHPVLYMDHPFDSANLGRTLLSSSVTCKNHRIRWEASIHGKITTEPNAGSLPIKNVTITYSLLEEDQVTPIGCDGCNGITATTEGGAFNIAFNVDHEILYEKDTNEIPVKLTFGKTTVGDNRDIDHKFLCNKGEDDCSGDTGTIVYLSHLQFNEPLHVYDDTSVPFSGKVLIADTSHSGAPEGCAIADAEVCLIHERNVGGVMKTNETLVCGNTDPDGTYSLPVIIGSRVDYVDVMYHNHTFEALLDLEQDSGFAPGIVIEAERYYHGMDFVDVSKARLMVDVVGGLCNKNIGTSMIQVKIVGCDWNSDSSNWDTVPKTQPTTRGVYNNVPAHLLEVQVIDITDSTTNERYGHIWSFFQGAVPLARTIDLKSVGAADEAIEEERESLSSESDPGDNSILYPIADTYIRGGSYTDKNYDNENELMVKNNSNSTNETSIVLFRFNMTDVMGRGDIKGVLELNVTDVNDQQPSREVCLYKLESSNWHVHNVTWNTFNLTIEKEEVSCLNITVDMVGTQVSFKISGNLMKEEELELSLQLASEGNISFGSPQLTIKQSTSTGIESKDNIKKEQKNNLDTIKKEEEEDLELVRFQFDGELQMDVLVSPDSYDSSHCSSHISSQYDSYSFHILEYMTAFMVTVDLKYEIIKDKVYCDIVDSELKLHVKNQVGVDENAGYKDFFNSISDKSTKDFLTKCSDGCLYDIGHEVDEEGNPISGANVVDWFASGRPNIAAPFTKSMIFTIQGGTGDITHTADFVVEGYYSKGPGRSFALPTHKPIMILRDPPGGLSYATYKNVVTTMKLETSSTSRSNFYKFGFNLKAVVEKKKRVCAGGGVGAIVLACKKLAELDQKMQVFGFDTTNSFGNSKDNKERSNQFSTTWSYQTSSDPWTAGAMSDVFVVPNLNVKYREVYTIEWNNETCAVNTEDDGTLPITTTFNIEDTENEPALAFFSRYHVKYVKKPELEAAMASKASQKDDCGCNDEDTSKVCTYFEADGTEKTTTCLEIANEIGSLQAGIDGWNVALDSADDTFETNTNDPSKSINNWFTEYGIKDMYESDAVVITDHASGLEPPSLPKESLENEFADDVEDKPVKRIQFSGGGNLFSMTMNKEKVLNEVELSCWEGCNRESDNNIKGPGLDEVKFKAFGLGLETQFLPLDFNIHWSHESTKSEKDTSSTSVGFVLGDEDPQDEFVVNLFYDAKFGTIIFKTVAGQSKCPHELNTAAIEDPRLIITRRPPQHVFPDEDMIFELEISNLGVGDESQFVLYAQHRDNDGGLRLFLDGGLVGGSTEFTNVRKDTTYKKTLVVKRGPLLYQYSHLDLALESACEDSSSSINDLTASVFDETKSVSHKLYNVQENKDTFLIKFVEPCPKVEWAGELNRDSHFIVNTNSDDPDNLEVIVFNPNHGQSKFYNMTSDRLQNVFLYYREVGDLQWSKGRTEVKNDDGSADSLTIDFAAEYAYKEESDYGYSSLKWALANKVPEGTYEIRVDSECDQLGGPADMDAYSTPILSGVIDLTPPEQYGRALPLRESILVGEEIAVVFTEPVRCEAFDLAVTVHLDEMAKAVCGQYRKCKVEPEQVPKTSLHGVRCCSDEDKSGIDNWEKNDGCNVWTKARNLDGKCHMKETYEDAEALCERNGARLCTKEELENHCTKVLGCYRKNLLVWSSDSFESEELDKNDPAIQIACDGRKVGFQIDPAQVNIEDWIGARFTVEMGKTTFESKSNIFDINGNPIKGNVKFEKTVGNIDLNQASTSFTVTLNGLINCADVSSELCANEVRKKIALLFGLSSRDQGRIEVQSVTAISEGTVEADIKILPSNTGENGRMLRYDESPSIEATSADHSVGLFRKLQTAVKEVQDHGTKLSADVPSSDSRNAIIGVRDMKILPGNVDMKTLTTDPELVEEEEELYRFGSMKGNHDGRASQAIMNKVDRQAMVEEIDSKSKSREEAMMNKIERMSDVEDALFRELKESKVKSQAELKALRFELVAVTLACVGISLVAFITLRRD